MIIPVKIEIESWQAPISNYIIIALTSIFFFFSISEANQEIFESMILKDFNPAGLLGSIFLHGDLFHLLGNMLFLFVFGSAVCALFGNALYPFIYLFLGLIASVIHLVVDGNPAVGASGAISGLMGLVLAFFPKEKVRFFYFFGILGTGTFRLKALYTVLFYLFMDLIGVLGGGSNIAHFAHIGGLAGGVGIGLLLQKLNVISIGETTLLDIFTGNKKANQVLNFSDLQEQVNNLKLEEELSKSELPQGFSIQQINGFQVNPQPQEYQPQEYQPQPEYQLPPEDVKVPQEALFKMRILRAIKNGSEIKCFLVNEGDTLFNISVKTTAGDVCEILPAEEFKSKGTGVLKITGLSSLEDKVEMKIKYNNSTFTSHKEIIFDPSQNKISEKEIIET